LYSRLLLILVDCGWSIGLNNVLFYSFILHYFILLFYSFVLFVYFVCFLQPAGGGKKAEGGEKDDKEGMEEFLHTGRTGRRNAVADINDEKTNVTSTSGLPDDMASLSCSGSLHAFLHFFPSLCSCSLLGL
jgi:hypothetical protein